jgi:hypothetical protein
MEVGRAARRSTFGRDNKTCTAAPGATKTNEAKWDDISAGNAKGGVDGRRDPDLEQTGAYPSETSAQENLGLDGLSRTTVQLLRAAEVPISPSNRLLHSLAMAFLGRLQPNVLSPTAWAETSIPRRKLQIFAMRQPKLIIRLGSLG